MKLGNTVAAVRPMSGLLDVLLDDKVAYLRSQKVVYTTLLCYTLVVNLGGFRLVRLRRIYCKKFGLVLLIRLGRGQQVRMKVFLTKAIVERHCVDMVEVVLVLGLVIRQKLIKVDLLLIRVTGSMGAWN